MWGGVAGRGEVHRVVDRALNPTQARRPDWIVIAPPRGLALRLGELWSYRELLGFIAWRDVSVRYKQSVLGVLWALLTPLVTVSIFTLIFGRVAKIPSDGVPYPVFCYVGLLPWLFFAQSVQRATVSMVAERNLLTKIYFPRLIVPISSTLAPLVDLVIASSLLAAMMAWYGVIPTPHALYVVPLCLLWTWLVAIGVGALLSALNVYFRDVGQMIPFLIQVWMYASPVVYPTSLLPERLRWLHALNPMVGVIDGLRSALVVGVAPEGPAIAVPLVVSLVLVVIGIGCFARMERSFADVV
jgi:lipopolysaccharide transport system permease protein